MEIAPINNPWPSGDGEMAARIRQNDWAATPFGPIDGWPVSLKTVVDLMIASRFPMFVAWGPELAFIYNDSYAEILGDKHPSSLGSPFKDIWREIWDDIAPYIDSAMSGKATWIEDLPLTMNRHGHDEETWFTFSYSPMRDDAGEIAGMYCAVTETSRHVRARRALRESEERFREHFENANDFIFTADLDMCITSGNPAVARALGHRVDDLIGHSISEFVPPEMWARNKAMLAAKLGGDTDTTRYEVDVFDARGERMTWEINSRLTRDASGAPTGLHAIGRDITERKASEQALRESEGRLRLIYDSLDEYAIFTLDRRGIVMSWNEGAERLLGYSEAEALGMDGCDIFTPEDREKGEADRELETAFAEGCATNERWHVRKDGSRFWGSGAVLSMLDGDGNGGGNGNGGEPVLVKIMRDDTRRVLDDERQKLLLSELQHRVRNTLGIVRSIARQSKRGHETVDEYVTHLVGRMDALARTQVLLTRAAGARVDLEELVREELIVQACDQGQIVVHGPKVSLPAKAAEVLTLAVHELATNAVKYGALATSNGRLSVTWTLETRANGEWLDMQWVENCGWAMPPPTQRGFGSDLIERRVPYELHGEANMDFTPEGLHARIAFPLVDAASVLESGPAREMGR